MPVFKTGAFNRSATPPEGLESYSKSLPRPTAIAVIASLPIACFACLLCPALYDGSIEFIQEGPISYLDNHF